MQTIFFVANYHFAPQTPRSFDHFHGRGGAGRGGAAMVFCGAAMVFCGAGRVSLFFSAAR